jgi:hypothetical protein
VIAFTTTVQEPALREVGADWILKNCADVRLLDHHKELTLELKQPSKER